LSLEEEGVYRRLLDFYYDTEQPIPLETQPVIRRLRLGSHSDIVGSILEEFFHKGADGWRNNRADFEISEYQKRAERARANGINGGRPKKNKGLKTQSVSVDNPDLTQTKANHNHNHNQEPKINTPAAPHESKLDYSWWPEQPNQQILKDWIAMRKGKKAPVSQTVINRYAKQLELACKDGRTVDECLSMAITKGWLDFKYEWFLNEERKNGNSASGPNYRTKSQIADDAARSALQQL